MTYTVMDYDIGESEQGSVIITIRLKRMVSQHILSTYLPSLCILIIAQVSSGKLPFSISPDKWYWSEFSQIITTEQCSMKV